MPHGLLEQSGSERKAQDRKVSVEKNFQDIKILKILDFKIQDFQPPKNDRSSNLFFSMKGWELAISVARRPGNFGFLRFSRSQNFENFGFEDFEIFKIFHFFSVLAFPSWSTPERSYHGTKFN